MAIRKAGIPIEGIQKAIDAWRAVLPPYRRPMTRLLRLHLRASELTDCYSGTRYLWASAQRAGVRCLLTEDLQDGFTLQSIRFINPFQRANDRLIDEMLPPGPVRTSGTLK